MSQKRTALALLFYTNKRGLVEIKTKRNQKPKTKERCVTKRFTKHCVFLSVTLFVLFYYFCVHYLYEKPAKKLKVKKTAIKTQLNRFKKVSASI